MNRFVQNLLDMAKLGHGKLEPKRDWCDVQDLLKQARERVGRQLAGRKLDLHAEPEIGLLHVDPVLIEQVFVNVLENAAKYSPPDGTIKVAVRPNKDEVVVDVEDNGPGISAADRERVFDPFQRAPSMDHVKPGTGLGLSICRGLLAAHDGRILALAGANGGALIRITLPKPAQLQRHADHG